jgi:hypothetical protein
MSRRRTKTFAGVAMLAVAGTFAATALAADFESRVTIRNGPPAFHGLVKSENENCIELRTVKLFKQKNSGNVLKGKDETNAAGRWQVLIDPKSGSYFAKVTELTQGNRTCLKDKSRVVTVD